MPKIISQNKTLSSIIVIIFGLVLSWGIWITTSTFKNDTSHAISEKTIQGLCFTLEEFKKSNESVRADMKEFREEMKSQRELIYTNQEKILEKLGELSKVVKLGNPNSKSRKE